MNYKLIIGNEKDMESTRGKPIIFIILSVFILSSCASGKVPISKFKRIDQKVGNFTKHVEQSIFKETDKGLYSVEALLFKGNLKVGRNDFDIVIHDQNDEDVEDVYLKIIARMPKYQLDAKPRIQGSRPGLYGVHNLNLPRAGHWELFIYINHNQNEDSVVFNFPDVR